MNKIIEDLDHDEDIVKIPLWKRLIILVFYYVRLVLHDLVQAMSNLTDKDKRKVTWKNIKSFANLFYRKFMQESILKESAALTYITLLGFIPFLILVVFFVPKLPFLSGSNAMQTNLYENFLPMSTGDIGPIISELISQEISFNIFSFIVVIITSYALFRVIRDTFDRILKMKFLPPKDFLSQIIKFFGTIIFGFLIILLLFSSSSLPIISSLLDIPFFRQQLVMLLPLILQFVALVFLYMTLPSIKVSRKSLFRGAFWTTVVWVIAKSLFDYYVYNLTNISAVYGVLKSLPAFLFWIYINWVIILAGIVLVAILEHKDKAVEKKVDRHFVRMTLELYTNEKMQKQIDTIISKDDLPGVMKKLTKEPEI